MKSLSFALLAGCTLIAVPAWAQSTTMPGRGGVQPAVKFDNGQQGDKSLPPPPALPGSRTELPTPAPASKAALDMSPNDALFDAINRGDVANARDAINRGADPASHNVLGMTPLELSVDLGRNDISFMLLSLRGDDGGHAPPPGKTVATAAAPTAAAPTVPLVRRGHSTRVARHAAPALPPADDADATPASVPMPDDALGSGAGNAADPTASAATPPLFAEDGGTPKPQAGFLGFNHH